MLWSPFGQLVGPDSGNWERQPVDLRAVATGPDIQEQALGLQALGGIAHGIPVHVQDLGYVRLAHGDVLALAEGHEDGG
jgi:hypothetical protein